VKLVLHVSPSNAKILPSRHAFVIVSAWAWRRYNLPSAAAGS
jgi:hypothetical protein